MKIRRISVHQVDVPIKPATISHNRVMSVFDETIVRIETDSGIDGWGDSGSPEGEWQGFQEAMQSEPSAIPEKN